MVMTGSSAGPLRHVLSGLLAAFFLLFTPLSPLTLWRATSPITAAHANQTTDDLKKCLAIMTAAGQAVGAVTDAAGAISSALADPTYAACMAEAASPNPITIGFMGAMTAIFVAQTAGGEQPFSDPASCNQAVKNLLVQTIASALNDMIDDDLVGGLLKSILPDAAVDLIQKVASAAAGEVAPMLAESLMNALGPVAHYLECGCAAAGTAAIVYEAGKAIAEAGKGVVEAAGACGDLATAFLDNPGGVVGAILDDPGLVLTAIAEAVCGIGEITQSVCNVAGFVIDIAKAACEATGACEAVGVVWDGVQEIGSTVACFFTNCDDPPPPSPPPACAPGATVQTSLTQGAPCQCQAPNGWVWETQYVFSPLAGAAFPQDVRVCRSCAANEGLANGWCFKCPTGFTKDPATGACSRPIICAPGSIVNADNTGCWTCPGGTQFSSDGKACVRACPANRPDMVFNENVQTTPPVNYPQTAGFAPWRGGDCRCPGNTYDNGQACVAIPTCSANMTFNVSLGACMPDCGPNGVLGPTIDGRRECVACGAGQVAANGQCVAPCGDGQVRIGDACIFCPGGSQPSGASNAAGEQLSCSSVCGPGRAYAPPPTSANLRDLTPGAAAQTNANVAAELGAAVFQQGGVKIQPVEIAWQTNLPGGSLAPSGTRNGGGSGGSRAADRCRPCAADQVTVTTSYMTSSGGVIEEKSCASCPRGQVANASGSQCVPNIQAVLAALRRPGRSGSSSDAPPAGTVPRSVVRPPQTPPRQPPSAVAATPRAAPAASAPLRCPPGRVPNRSGTACVLDAGDFGPASGGSMGGVRGR
jgi:hypothetical protein